MRSIYQVRACHILPSSSFDLVSCRRQIYLSVSGVTYRATPFLNADLHGPTEQRYRMYIRTSRNTYINRYGQFHFYNRFFSLPRLVSGVNRLRSNRQTHISQCIKSHAPSALRSDTFPLSDLLEACFAALMADPGLT